MNNLSNLQRLYVAPVIEQVISVAIGVWRAIDINAAENNIELLVLTDAKVWSTTHDNILTGLSVTHKDISIHLTSLDR